MTIWIKEFGMQLLIWLLGFVDNVFNVFRALAGVETVTTPETGEDGVTLTEYFLGLGAVQKAFVVVLIASVAICGVCTIVAVVKNVVGKNGETKSMARTVGQSVSTVFVSLALAGIMLGGIGVADGLLRTVDRSVNPGEPSPMSHNIINVSVGGGYEFDVDNVQELNKKDEDGNWTYISYLYEFAKEPDGKPKCYGSEQGDYAGCIIYLDQKGQEYAEPSGIYTALLDADGAPVLDENGRQAYTPILSALTPVRTTSGWLKQRDGTYWSMTDLKDDIMSMTVRDIFGDYNKAMFVFPTSWQLNGMIAPDSFNMFVAYLCTIVVLVALIGATFGLVKRLFDLVILFIALPGIAATLPLDDGAKFKLWRETVISKVFLAFGTVLAVNVFCIVAPSLWDVTVGGGFTDTILRVVLICGGALTISGGQILFARLLGTSAEESREMGQSARTLFGGAMTGLGMAKAAGRGLFGYRNANGQRVGGLIKGGASALGTVGFGAVNAVGGAIGGQAYRGSAAGYNVSKVQQALKGFSRSSGWFGGGGKDNPNLGYGLSAGAHKLGSKVSGSGLAQKIGLDRGLSGVGTAIRQKVDTGYSTRLDAESYANARAADLAEAFGVSPYAVKHVKNKDKDN